MQSTLSLTLDLTQKKGFFTDTTDYNAIGVDVNTLGATGSVAVYFQGELLPGPSPTINLAGGTTSSLFDLELDLNGEVANGSYSAVYTLNYNFISSVSSVAPNQLTIYTLGSNYQGFPAGTSITIPVNLALGANVVSATDNGGDLEIIVDGTVTSIPPASRAITAEQSGGSFSWVYAGCTLVEAQSGLVADCDFGDFGTFTVSNQTNTTGITINSLTADINYPSWTNQPVITVTSLPYTNNELATGTYSVTLTLEIEKVQNDGLIIVYTASSIQEFKVSCIGSLCGLNACLENLRAAHESELLRNRISKYQVFVDNILIYYTEAQSYRSCGQMDEYRATVAKIEAQLDASGCDCGCCDENQYIWVQNTSPAASIIMQEIAALQDDVATLQGDVATLQVDSIFTANNGLTKAGNNVALGGTLLGDTTINASGNTLSIESNDTDPLVVKTTTGSPASFTVTSPTGTIADNVRLVTTALLGPGVNGIGSGLSFEAEKANSAVSVTSVIKSSWVDATAGDSKFEIGVTEANLNSTALTIESDGELQLNNYGDGTFTGSPTYILSVDVDGKVIETEVDNGLTKSSGSIQLGGTLLNDTTIIGDGKNLSIQSGDPLDVSDFRIENYARLVLSSINSLTSPLYYYQNNSYPHHTSYSTISSFPTTGELRTFITNSGVPQANFGCVDTLNLEYSGGNSDDVLKISTTWDADPAVIRRGKYQITLRETNSNRLEVLTLRGTGAAQLDQYGDGNFTGTAAYNLAVDFNGNVIEVAAGAPLVYASRVTQGGFVAPVVTEMQNTTGATITWNYLAVGVYTITASSPVFTLDKTNIFITTTGSFPCFINANADSTTQCTVITFDGGGNISNGVLNQSSVKIEIYP
jgi:hypothetical protein